MAHAHASNRTRQMHLGALDRLYASAEAQLGADRLDNVLAAGDFHALENVLAGFLGKLRNDGLISGADRSGAWRTAVTFVGDVMRLRGTSTSAELSEMESGLRRLERLYGQLGACSSGQSLCSRNPVLSCYTCRRFMPLRDAGVHNRVVESLRPVVMEFDGASRGNTTSPAFSQLHRTLDAARRVAADIEADEERWHE